MSTKNSLNHGRDDAKGQRVHLYQDEFDEESV
jgi:hypothetical protein